jgi:heme-degrading monooxygenase HmoA
MQQVVIDAFIVPEASKAAFLDTSRAVQNLLKTLPGFVEGYVYEQTAGDGPYNIMTTAVWRDEAALENAKNVAPAQLRTLGINPAEKMKALNVQIERGVYERTAY